MFVHTNTLTHTYTHETYDIAAVNFGGEGCTHTHTHTHTKYACCKHGQFEECRAGEVGVFRGALASLFPGILRSARTYRALECVFVCVYACVCV